MADPWVLKITAGSVGSGWAKGKPGNQLSIVLDFSLRVNMPSGVLSWMISRLCSSCAMVRFVRRAGIDIGYIFRSGLAEACK